MTARADIAPNDKGWRRLSYTCRCGWVDWGHALPDGPMGLKNQLDTGHPSFYYYDRIDVHLNGRPAFVLIYGQSMGRRGVVVSTDRHWVVLKGLTQRQREEVGLGIFMSASQTFEKLQGSFPFSLFSGKSSFSAEDLVSNLIGFYAAFRGVTQQQLRRTCGEVSVEASHAVWDTHVPKGLQTYRNHGYKPLQFPCDECKGADTSFPSELAHLKAALPGNLYVAPERLFIPGELVNAAVPLDIDSAGRIRIRR